VITIKFGDRGIAAALKEIQEQVTDRMELMDKAGRTIRDYARETVRMQGRRKPYPPMTRSSKQTSGRNKLFSGVPSDIIHVAHNDRFIVYFNRVTVGWSLEMHTKGINIPSSRGITMMIPNGLGKARSSQGQFLGGNLGPKFFRFRRAFKIPAREIWPSRPEVIHQINEVLRQWLADLKRAVHTKYKQNGGT